MLGTYYSDRFVGRKTSAGDVFRQNQYTAAHKSLPLGAYVMVRYPVTNLSIVVRVNDRCPRAGVLDMTKLACRTLGIKGSGQVEVTPLDPEMGSFLLAHQDTTWMPIEDYLAFRDKSKSRRISPYRLSPTDKPSSPPPANPAKPAQATPARPAPPQKVNNQKLTTSVSEPTVPEPVVDVLPVDTVVVAPRPKGPLYDVELCTVGSLAIAQIESGRIPQELQDKVVFDQNKQNREVRIYLRLANSRSHAVRTQVQLIELFPESCVIPHVQE